MIKSGTIVPKNGTFVPNKRTPHHWVHAPHYADILRIVRGTLKTEHYWWCTYCEEHRFQKDKPEPGMCLVRPEGMR